MHSHLNSALPTGAELPSSDDTPVDNEDQNFIPNVLLFLLEAIWGTRNDWFFGVDMAIYHTTGVSPRLPVVPDGFLSLGVERRKQGKPRWVGCDRYDDIPDKSGWALPTLTQDWD